MKRFFLVSLFSLAILSVGVWLKGRQPHSKALEISINFKSLSRLVYEGKKLTEDPTSVSELVPLNIGIKGVFYRGKVKPLPLSEGPMSALFLEIDERETSLPQYLLLLKKGAIALPQNAEVFAEGELSLNGRALEPYQLVVHPFLSAIEKGYGPLIHWVNGKMELSPMSERFEVLRTRKLSNTFDFSNSSDEWWAWDPENGTWRPWGKWPKGWPL